MIFHARPSKGRSELPVALALRTEIMASILACIGDPPAARANIATAMSHMGTFATNSVKSGSASFIRFGVRA